MTRMRCVSAILSWQRRLAALALSLLVAACGGGGNEHEHDEPETIDTAGRLVVIDKDSPTVRVLELDDPNFAVEATYTVDNPPSAVYTSPQGRYAAVVQRLQDRVQFIDGGIWQEDHGNHLHDYKKPSRMMGWGLTGPRPTHYDVQAGRQAAFFMDGNTTATPPQNAGVRLFDDRSVATGQLLASLDFDFAIHGLAEPVGDKLLTVSRASDAPDTLPTHLNLYLRSGSTFNFVRQLPTRCNGMHGSFSSGSHTLVGCRDGMVLVRHTGATTVNDGQFLATPSRVSTVAGHPRLPDHFIGFGTHGTAPDPQTTRFYAVDAAAGSAVEIVPQGWETGRLRRAHSFDRSGQRFYILDNQGTLTVLQRSGSTWTTTARVTGVIPSMPSAAPFPAIVHNGARDEIYLTDPVANQLVVVNAATGAVQRRLNLGFSPRGAAWVGITR